ncbi:hypothetical protein [Streptomyces sp. NPDC050560]|uniref:hypothetical protein n=1 Tax=Streptomyces sp. NPDC050560 TaxID=3365630 RepID=UPI0037A1A2AE
MSAPTTADREPVRTLDDLEGPAPDGADDCPAVGAGARWRAHCPRTGAGDRAEPRGAR